MRFWTTKAIAVLLALHFPWGAAASGGMVLCIDSGGHVGFGPGNGLACGRASSLAEPAPAVSAPCTLCLEEHGCADVPGKGLLQRAPPNALERRAAAGHGVPYALSMAPAGIGGRPTSILPPAHVFAGQHGMRLRLASLSTVVLRL